MAVYSVSQVNSYLKDILQREFVLQDIWISGEVANLSRPGSGHSYFTLREASTSLRCVMFRTAVGAERLNDGAAVIAHGRITLYEARGDLQLIVDMVQPEGVGELQLRFEQLRAKLEAEGLFDPARKRAPPRFPRRVGVITSPTGSVWQDIRHVVARRYPLAELALAPAPVQGDAAAQGIVDAFQALNRASDFDTIILARGGGSLEDLRPFNEEAVARAVYSSRAPVITGIGHETDYTIADMVADQRAPTPSAAAEMAVPDRAGLAAHVLTAEQGLGVSVARSIRARTEALAQITMRLRRGYPDLDSMRIRIDDLLRTAAERLRQRLAVSSERFDGLKRRLDAGNPRDILRRGYAVVQARDGKGVVTDAAQVAVGDTVAITLSRGALDADVTSIRRSQNA
ncbi:MAG: exodeoxyribonuclease VII large subunit [Chloroflexi bacterium]|nr:exodeoxyribonuclease VII large subunit [Chloroflexota bacterium]